MPIEIGPGHAAAAVMGIQLTAGLYMSFGIRVGTMGRMTKEECEVYLKSEEYDNVSRVWIGRRRLACVHYGSRCFVCMRARVFLVQAQLNQAEWAPMLFGALLFLNVKKASGPMVTAVSILCPASQVRTLRCLVERETGTCAGHLLLGTRSHWQSAAGLTVGRIATLLCHR